MSSRITSQIHPTHFRGAAAVANATVLAPLQWSADLRRYALMLINLHGGIIREFR